MRKISKFLVPLMLALALTLVFGVTAFAQGDKNQPGSMGLFADSASESLSIMTTESSSEYLAILVRDDGRFNSGGTRTPVDPMSWFNISYMWPYNYGTSFTSIMIDGSADYYGGGSGVLVQAPTDDPSNMANNSIWQYGDVEVKQTLQIVNGTSTGLPDTGMYKYTVRNTGTESHNVGIRIMIDTMLNNNDGAPFRVPGVGAVTQEMEFLGEDIPQYWQAFYSLDNPDVMAQGTLIGGGATTPDRFVLSDWTYIVNTIWDYTVNPLESVTNDSAVAVYWYPVSIGPGESREFVTFYGLGEISGTADLSITGPGALDVVGGQWSPSPFSATAYIANNTAIAMSDVPVTIALPSGLGLAPGENGSHSIAGIAPGATEQTSWDVVPLVAGDWTYSVTAIGQTANRSISVPELVVSETTPPQTTCEVIPSANAIGWNNIDVAISLTAVDNEGGSGVKEIHYQINSDPEQVVTGATAAFTLAETTTFSFWAVDNAGNVEESESRTIKIDKVDPVTTIDVPIVGSYLNTDSITLQYSVSDALSGIDTISATLDGTPVENGDVIDLSTMAGSHTLTVVVTDKAGNETSDSVEFSVQIAASVDIKPDTLDLGSKSDMSAVTVYIEFPSDYDVNLIDISTVELDVNGTIVSTQASPVAVGDYDSDGISDVMVKFDREAIIAALSGQTGRIAISVYGQLNDGSSFMGSDVIKVMFKSKK